MEEGDLIGCNTTEHHWAEVAYWTFSDGEEFRLECLTCGQPASFYALADDKEARHGD